MAARKGFLNSRNLQLREVEIGLGHLPSSFNGLRIGQITDIHAGPLVPRDFIREGVDLIMDERPDLIVLTGDFMNGNRGILRPNNGSFKQHHYDYCIDELARLNAPLGVYGVLGNHDFWSGKKLADSIADDLNSVGIRILRNQSVPLKENGQQIYLIGVDDYWEDSYDLSLAMRGVPEDGCRILLSHNPDVNEDISALEERIDLVISGHTHGGQVVLPVVGFPYLLSPFGQKYRSGVVRDGQRVSYISCGLGAYLAPIRLNCPPDVSILTLYRQTQDSLIGEEDAVRKMYG